MLLRFSVALVPIYINLCFVMASEDFDFDTFGEGIDLDGLEFEDAVSAHVKQYVERQWKEFFKDKERCEIKIDTNVRGRWNAYIASLGSGLVVDETHDTEKKMIQRLEYIYLKEHFNDLQRFLNAFYAPVGEAQEAFRWADLALEYTYKESDLITALERKKTGKSLTDIDDKFQLLCNQVPRHIWWNRVISFITAEAGNPGMRKLVENEVIVQKVKSEQTGPGYFNMYKAIKVACDKMAKGKLRTGKDIFNEHIQGPGNAEFTYEEASQRMENRKGSPNSAPYAHSEWPAIKALIRIVVDWHFNNITVSSMNSEGAIERKRTECIAILNGIPDRFYPLKKDFPQLQMNPAASRMAQHMLMVAVDASHTNRSAIVDKACTRFPPKIPKKRGKGTPVASDSNKGSKRGASDSASGSGSGASASASGASGSGSGASGSGSGNSGPNGDAGAGASKRKGSPLAGGAKKLSNLRRSEEQEHCVNLMHAANAQFKNTLHSGEIMILPPMPIVPNFAVLFDNPNDTLMRLQRVCNEQADEINQILVRHKFREACNSIIVLIDNIKNDMFELLASDNEKTFMDEHVKQLYLVGAVAISCEMKHAANRRKEELKFTITREKFNFTLLQKSITDQDNLVGAPATTKKQKLSAQQDIVRLISAKRNQNEIIRHLETQIKKAEKNVNYARELKQAALENYNLKAEAKNTLLEKLVEKTPAKKTMVENIISQTMLPKAPSGRLSRDYDQTDFQRRWSNALKQIELGQFSAAKRTIQHAQQEEANYKKSQLEFVDELGGLTEGAVNLFHIQITDTDDSFDEELTATNFSAPEQCAEISKLIPRFAHKLVF